MTHTPCQRIPQPERHHTFMDWCKRVSIDPHTIPAEYGALTVTPISEGELVASYVQFVIGDDGRRHLDSAGGFVRRTGRTERVVTEAPPGFSLPRWDAYAYAWTEFA